MKCVPFHLTCMPSNNLETNHLFFVSQAKQTASASVSGQREAQWTSRYLLDISLIRKDWEVLDLTETYIITRSMKESYMYVCVFALDLDEQLTVIWYKREFNTVKFDTLNVHCMLEYIRNISRHLYSTLQEFLRNLSATKSHFFMRWSSFC